MSALLMLATLTVLCEYTCVVVLRGSDNDGAILEPTQPISQGATVLSVLF